MSEPRGGGEIVLAFDTSGVVGSVALAVGGRVVQRAVLEARAEHGARLVPAIAGVLEAHGAGRDDVDAVVVGEGPGSFTGVRISAATAKGLTHAWAKPLWAVSSLAAAALSRREPGIRYVLFDARADRVYGACFDVRHDSVSTLVPPHAGTLGEVLDSALPPGAAFCGDGAMRHRAMLESAGHAVDAEVDGRRFADGLLWYLQLRPGHAPVEDPGRWEPEYLRPSNAVVS